MNRIDSYRQKNQYFQSDFSLKLYEKADFNSNLALKEILIWYNKLYLCIVCFLPDWRSNMPNYEKNSQKSDFVDISSNKQVKKLYNKKGRLKRILCLVFSIIFLNTSSGKKLPERSFGMRSVRVPTQVRATSRDSRFGCSPRHRSAGRPRRPSRRSRPVWRVCGAAPACRWRRH